MRRFTTSILLVLALTVSLSCEKDESPLPFFTCDVVNPTKNLPWLKTMIDSWKSNRDEIYLYLYVTQGTYLGETVFIVANCCPFCDSYFPVYTCEGNEIHDIRIQDITDQKVIWKPFGSKCNL